MKELLGKIKLQFIFFLARLLPDCKHITPLFSESLDRKTTLKEKIVMRLHLFTCGACVNYLSNLKFMREVFRTQEENLEREKLSVSLSPDARERLKNALKPQS